MKKRIQILNSFVLVLGIWSSPCLAQDSLACFEITSRSNLVQSSVVQIPANMQASISFQSNNTNGMQAYSQGCLLTVEGQTFVKYQVDYDQNTSERDITNATMRALWSTRAFPSATPTSSRGFHSINGPASVSFFCRGASLRASVYVESSWLRTNFFTKKVFRASERTFTLAIPANSLAYIQDHENFGFENPTKSSVAGQQLQFNSNTTSPIIWPSGVGFTSLGRSEPKQYNILYGFGQNTNRTSSVVSWATVQEYREGYRAVEPHLFGPTRITYTYANSNNLKPLTRIYYYISPAKFSNQNFTASIDARQQKEFRTQNSVIVLEQSENGGKWSTTEDQQLTTLIGQMTYRFRIEDK